MNFNTRSSEYSVAENMDFLDLKQASSNVHKDSSFNKNNQNVYISIFVFPSKAVSITHRSHPTPPKKILYIQIITHSNFKPYNYSTSQAQPFSFIYIHYKLVWIQPYHTVGMLFHTAQLLMTKIEVAINHFTYLVNRCLCVLNIIKIRNTQYRVQSFKILWTWKISQKNSEFWIQINKIHI